MMTLSERSRTAAASAATLAGLSTATMRSPIRLLSAISRSIAGADTTGEVIRIDSTPPDASTSASPSFAQHRPIAPASSCMRAIARLLCVLACGRSATPARLASAAIFCTLRPSASRSSTSTGVFSSRRDPGLPIRCACRRMSSNMIDLPFSCRSRRARPGVRWRTSPRDRPARAPCRSARPSGRARKRLWS